MNSFTGRHRRKSEVSPMLNLHPEPRSAASGQGSGGPAQRRLSKMTTVVRSSIIAPAQPLSLVREEPPAVTSSPSSSTGEPTPASDVADLPGELPPLPSKKAALFSSAARSVISQRREKQEPQQSAIPEEGGDELIRPAVPATTATAAAAHDPWSSVLHKVAKKINATSVSDSSSRTTRISLAHVLKSHGVKNLVKQAVVASKGFKSSAPSSSSSAAVHQAAASSSSLPEARSAVMEHWVKTAMLRHQTDFDDSVFDENDEDEDDDAKLGIESGFDVRESRTKQMYGRTLLLEESCRRAFAQSGENRSQMDLQALKAWFQMTKLKITTDFERLQPAELDLLCRRMVLASFHPKEVVFRQGDEGDALYLVFAGVVEVRVSQRILGEKVEVTVCELSKGDYFGERSLLSNDVRAATVIAKTSTELVRISSKDYNIMLKKDQMEFLSRMQMANGMVIPKSVQQSQREYIKVLTKKKNARSKADIDMLGEYLQTLKFFRALPKTFVRELCTVVDFLTLPAGAPVFKEGEVGDLFYIIFTGSVDVIVGSKDFRGNAQQTKLINLTEGSHFGELALMKGHGIRSATVMTREECRFLVICERDYNATLRRMQKEDLAKRVGVLDQILIFQTPEWTGELLKEMSYVLSEQKLATGSELFRQGDKALQVFFVVRGELVVTKEIADPASHATHTVFVERVGRYRVVGDDAAAGTTFNESIFREVTVTASTPVEVLVLSKYDVFHRLSRAAREALRTAAHSHAESVVYLDRFHKTDKWTKYKQRVLRQHVNHERLARILPQTPRSPAPADGMKRPRRVKPDATASESTQASPFARPSCSTVVPPETPEDVASLVTNKSPLVDANEFLLLVPHDHRVPDNASTQGTIGHFVSTFNADAPPSVARKKRLEDVLVAERRRQVTVLNEGNPLAYFDLQEIKQQEKKHHAEARGRAASTRRTLLIGSAAALAAVNGANAGVSGSPNAFSSSLDSPLPSPMPTKAVLVDKVARTVMNQFAHENFVFSRPVRIQDGDDVDAFAHRHRHRHHSSESEQRAASRRTSSARKERAEQLCDGEFIVISVQFPDSSHEQYSNSIVRSLQSPRMRILQATDSLVHAREIVKRAQVRDATRSQMSYDSGEASSGSLSTTTGAAYYLVPKRKYAVVPRSELHAHSSEEKLQRELWERFARSSVAPSSAGALANPNPASPHTTSHARRPSVPAALYGSGGAYPERQVATAPVLSSTSLATVSPAEASGLFGSFQKIEFTGAEQCEIAASAQEEAKTQGATEAGETQATAVVEPAELNPSPPSPRPQLFAVASVILSKHEIENAVGEESFLCVHQLFASEMQAMDAALTMTPLQHFRNAMLCVVPLDESLHLEDAYDWCIQVEPDRREKRGSASAVVVSPKRNSRNAVKVAQFPHHRMSEAASRGSPRPRSPGAASKPGGIHTTATTEWQAEREKAHRLHQFICSRLGQKATLDKERREQQETTGFTPKALLTLDEKLATLHEYLESSSAAALNARGTAGGGSGAHAMGKYRQMKKFGSIMKARLGSTLATSGLSLSLLNGNGGSTPASPGTSSQPSSPLTAALAIGSAATQ